jgi:hypothetical protein
MWRRKKVKEEEKEGHAKGWREDDYVIAAQVIYLLAIVVFVAGELVLGYDSI